MPHCLLFAILTFCTGGGLHPPEIETWCDAMAYRKLHADKIFTGTQLLEGHVLVIAGNGTVIDVINAAEAGADVELFNGWLCPGFINAHCHIELSHMRGRIPEKSGMTDFLINVLFDRQAADEQKQQAMLEAITAMHQNGIAAVGDICNTTDSAAVKAANNHLYFHNFIEVSGFVPGSSGARLSQALQVSNTFSEYFPIEQVSITPHAPYSVSEKLFQQIQQQSPRLLSIHNQESKAEDDFIRNKQGDLLKLYEAIGINIDFFEAQHTSSLQYMLPLLLQPTQLLLVHNCLTTRQDIDVLKTLLSATASQCHLCVCPNANLYIGNTLPDISMLVENEIPLCVGTDSLASNQQLSILSELQTLQQHFPELSSEVLLQWATINGATALKADKQFGSFEKGKRPGVLLLENMYANKLADAVVSRVA